MNKGKIIQIIGPVVDVEFPEEGKLPAMFNALKTKGPNGEVVLEVVKQNQELISQNNESQKQKRSESKKGEESKKKVKSNKKGESKETEDVKWYMEDREGIIRIVNKKGEEKKAESMMWEMRKV